MRCDSAVLWVNDTERSLLDSGGTSAGSLCGIKQEEDDFHPLKNMEEKSFWWQRRVEGVERPKQSCFDWRSKVPAHDKREQDLQEM